MEFVASDSAGHFAAVAPDATECLSFQTVPNRPGYGAAASAIKTPYNLNRGGWLLHVVIDFKRPIEGPMAIGLGRHYGIGLFAAIDD